MANPELYAVGANGNNLKRLTFAERSEHVAGVESEDGADGGVCERPDGRAETLPDEFGWTNTIPLDLPDKGYLIDPSWAPNGQLLAFSWRRPTGNYDLYVMDAATQQIRGADSRRGTDMNGRAGLRTGAHCV